MAAIPNRSLTDYTQIKVIKESPRGTVSLVKDPEDGTEYLLRRYKGDGSAYRKLLRVESEYLPKICDVLSTSDGEVTVVEEYIEGESLVKIIKTRRLTDREARKTMSQLCSALHTLHKADIVHRDIKPDNIIVCGDKAYLVDFDAARLYEPGSETDTQVLGTVGYAAPEQYGIYQSDKRSDIYALGVLLNVMLTGKHPSVGRLAHGPLRKIIQQCTMVNPDDRYQSAGQLMSALRFSVLRPWTIGACALVLAAAVLFSAGIIQRRISNQNKVPDPEYSDQLQSEPTSTPTPDPVPTPTPPAATQTNIVEPEGENDEYVAIDYTPNQWDSFPNDTWVNLPYKTLMFRANGNPSEGISFSRMLARKSEQGEVDIAVEFESEQTFTCVFFEPPGNRLQSFTNVQPEQTVLTVTMSVEELAQYEQLVFNFCNDSGRDMSSAEAWDASLNRNMIYIEGYVLNMLAPKSSEAAESIPTISYDDTWMELQFIARYIRNNGEPSEGVQFLRVLAKAVDEKTVNFVVEFEAEQNFGAAAFTPPGNSWQLPLPYVQAGQSYVSFSVETSELAGMSELGVSFSNDSGRYGNTYEEWTLTANVNVVFITRSEIEKILKEVPQPDANSDNTGESEAIEAIAYTPERWESFPIDTWVELPFVANYKRPDGTPSEGIEFIRMLGKKSPQGEVTFKVEFESEQVFVCAFGPDKISIQQISFIPPTNSSLTVCVPREELAKLEDVDQFTMIFQNDNGRHGYTDQEWLLSENRNTIYVNGHVIKYILE